jgi:hypothetical protein
LCGFAAKSSATNSWPVSRLPVRKLRPQALLDHPLQDVELGRRIAVVAVEQRPRTAPRRNG